MVKTADSVQHSVIFKNILNVEFESYPRSYAKLRQIGPIYVTPNGDLINPYSIEVFGKMADYWMGKELTLDHIYYIKK